MRATPGSSNAPTPPDTVQPGPQGKRKLILAYAAAIAAAGFVTLLHWTLAPWLGPLLPLAVFAITGILFSAFVAAAGYSRGQAAVADKDTSLREALDALRDSEARGKAILQTAVDGIITIDERGIIDSMNPAAERLFGYRSDEVIGKNVGLLMPSPYREEHDRYIGNYVRTGQRKIIGIGREVKGLRKDGGVFPMDLAVSEMFVRGRRMFTGLVHDLTEHKRTENQLRLTSEAAEAAHREAENANRMKDEFLATLSHELRTPLNAMLGWSRLMRMGGLDKETAEQAIEAIERNALAQAQLVEDLLDVSRIISGKLRLELREVDVQEVVAAAISSLQPAVDAKEIRLEQMLDNAGPIRVDPARLQQVIWNLVSNAIKFTPRGGCVKVSAKRDPSQLELRISDTGKGIAPDFLPHVFERFRQADASSTRAHSGLGLGLAIVRHIVEMHGGTTEASSPGLGLGATFVVRLPVRPVSSTSTDQPDIIPPQDLLSPLSPSIIRHP